MFHWKTVENSKALDRKFSDGDLGMQKNLDEKMKKTKSSKEFISSCNLQEVIQESEEMPVRSSDKLFNFEENKKSLNNLNKISYENFPKSKERLKKTDDIMCSIGRVKSEDKLISNFRNAPLDSFNSPQDLEAEKHRNPYKKKIIHKSSSHKEIDISLSESKIQRKRSE